MEDFACRIGTGKKVHLAWRGQPRCHVDSRHTRRGALTKVTGKISREQLCSHCWDDLRCAPVEAKRLGLELKHA